MQTVMSQDNGMTFSMNFSLLPPEYYLIEEYIKFTNANTTNGDVPNFDMQFCISSQKEARVVQSLKVFQIHSMWRINLWWNVLNAGLLCTVNVLHSSLKPNPCSLVPGLQKKKQCKSKISLQLKFLQRPWLRNTHRLVILYNITH